MKKLKGNLVDDEIHETFKDMEKGTWSALSFQLYNGLLLCKL